MTDSAPVSKVAFLGDYPPRQCGIATFTRDLRDAVAEANPGWSCPVIAVSDRLGEYHYPDDVRFEIPQPDMASYVRAEKILQSAQDHGGDQCLGAAGPASPPPPKSAFARLRDLLPGQNKASDLKRRTD